MRRIRTRQIAISPAGIYRSLFLSVLILFLVACGPGTPGERVQAYAEDYVTLALSLGIERPDEVDAYFGSESLDTRDEGSGPAISQLAAEARDLQQEIAADGEAAALERTRKLQARLDYFIALLEVIDNPDGRSFAEEVQQLYGFELPLWQEDAEGAKRVADELDAMLPGRGSLAFRIATYMSQLVVPADMREAVFTRAMEECRARTLQHWDLPAGESLNIEFTRDVDSAWHRYQGGGISTLQVNPLTVAFTGAAIDVACHEGYPGHHAQFVAWEQAAGEAGLPVEDTLVLLRTPEGVLREGAANYGVELVFPMAERIAFQRDVLFPMAGLPPQEVEKFARIQYLIGELDDYIVPILEDYRNEVVVFNSATRLLEAKAMVSSPSDLLVFADEFGAYNVGYTVVRDLIRDYVSEEASSGSRDEWAVLQDILIHPRDWIGSCAYGQKTGC